LHAGHTAARANLEETFTEPLDVNGCDNAARRVGGDNVVMHAVLRKRLRNLGNELASMGNDARRPLVLFDDMREARRLAGTGSHMHENVLRTAIPSGPNVGHHVSLVRP
jgi:hypothetical protein